MPLSRYEGKWVNALTLHIYNIMYIYRLYLLNLKDFFYMEICLCGCMSHWHQAFSLHYSHNHITYDGLSIGSSFKMNFISSLDGNTSHNKIQHNIKNTTGCWCGIAVDANHVFNRIVGPTPIDSRWTLRIIIMWASQWIFKHVLHGAYWNGIFLHFFFYSKYI